MLTAVTLNPTSFMFSFSFVSFRDSSVSALLACTSNEKVKESTETPSFLAWFCSTAVKKPRKQQGGTTITVNYIFKVLECIIIIIIIIVSSSSMSF